MSLIGNVPLRLTPADVWTLMRDRFNANEIAYLAGVSLAVARGMMNEATPRYRKPRRKLSLQGVA